MSDADQTSDSVVGSLGIDVDSVGATVPDDLWQAMLDVAFDPSTPPADSSVVPVMDDSGELPDDGSYDTDHTDHRVDLRDDSHDGHHGDDIVLDDDHAPVSDHHDRGDDGTIHDHDHGGEHHGGDHSGQDDSNWHV